jgi:hypothetical protein
MGFGICIVDESRGSKFKRIVVGWASFAHGGKIFSRFNLLSRKQKAKQEKIRSF